MLYDVINPHIPGPARIVSHPADKTVPQGTGVTLTCEAEGSPTPSIIWLKDGKSLPSDTRIRQHENLYESTIYITDVRVSDNGEKFILLFRYKLRYVFFSCKNSFLFLFPFSNSLLIQTYATYSFQVNIYISVRCNSPIYLLNLIQIFPNIFPWKSPFEHLHLPQTFPQIYFLSNIPSNVPPLI